jgi:eukaryotic-like serine/threonine-protein kinase
MPWGRDIPGSTWGRGSRHRAGDHARAGGDAPLGNPPTRHDEAQARPRPSHAIDPALPALTSLPARWIGRYRVLHELGRGGMGITYAAHDIALDRDIALKVVRPDVAVEEGAQTRLQWEAQALARLAHPNIVAVHDVGVHDGRTYLAMELVKGRTLDPRAMATTHTWQEVVQLFTQVGAGLQAAHEAGLVHRDVKPSNIMIGDDGRVRLLDFGLARAGDGRTPPPAGSPDGGRPDSDSSSLLVGTPGYVAPEQIDGLPADARSDQFSFCVTLFEALYGVRPFTGRNARILRSLIFHGIIRELPDEVAGRVPAWLHAAVVRGLAFDPAARWSSMRELLAMLQRAPVGRPWWRSNVAVGAGLGALAVAALALGTTTHEQPAAGMCTGGRAQIEEAWNDQQRAAVGRALQANGSPYAADAWHRTATLLDRYAEEWLSAYVASCTALATNEAWSEDAWGEERLVQMQCLAERRRSLSVLVDELTQLHGQAVHEAVQATSRLPRIATCADRNYLRTRIPPPEEPRVAEQVEAVRATVARAEELQKLGKFEESLAILLPLRDTVAALGYAPVQVEVLVRLGDLLEANGAYEEAEDHLREAYFLARALAYHAVASEAASLLVVVVGRRMARYDEGHEWGRHAQAELASAGEDMDRARLFFHLGQMMVKEGRYDDAAVHLYRALIIRERVLGREHSEVAASLNGLGEVARLRGQDEDAARLYLQAYSIYEQALGPAYPRLAYPLSNLGLVRRRQGRHQEAAEYFHRAWVVWEQALGPEHIELAYPLVGLAASYLELGRAAEALPLAERALRLREQGHVGPGELAEARFIAARALLATTRAAGRPAVPGANKEVRRALDLARQAAEAMASTPSAELQLDRDQIHAWLSASGS